MSSLFKVRDLAFSFLQIDIRPKRPVQADKKTRLSADHKTAPSEPAAAMAEKENLREQREKRQT